MLAARTAVRRPRAAARRRAGAGRRAGKARAVLDALGNEFVPAAVDADVVNGQLAVLGASVGLASYWWFVLVPSERGALSREKRRGELRAYLEELDKEAASAGTTMKGTKRLERWFYEDWLRRMPGGEYKKVRAEKDAARAAAAASVDEQGEGEGEVEAGKPALEEPRGTLFATAPGEGGDTPNFWSLDNPIVAAFSAIVLAGGLSSLLGGGT